MHITSHTYIKKKEFFNQMRLGSVPFLVQDITH